MSRVLYKNNFDLICESHLDGSNADFFIEVTYSIVKLNRGLYRLLWMTGNMIENGNNMTYRLTVKTYGEFKQAHDLIKSFFRYDISYHTNVYYTSYQNHLYYQDETKWLELIETKMNAV